ncbi:cysteine desulfurase family protein [Sphingomonas sp. LaA6.9]|uniref:cysteine desulfurase family protein n=1 Tax=Sphingomonas sp. LaA6.9 TaxID=2919914 RepID=UPI001F5002CE|nr:aminotransferase class V-fold PLP-dependent enzyme [Sphingomonas sp. LaA6.9]MCJ8157512.1 aminotransferase class V-fold PLP-dependent enzyme [Sphingomonas sp. LaA6.9]
MLSDRLYLDHAATTPVLPQARQAVAEGLARWANPSSPHAEGRAARAALEDARERIRKALGWEHELIFTSGATEAIRIALGRANADAQIVSAVEHDAVHRAAPKAFFLPVQGDGTVSRDALTGRLGALAAARPIVAIQSVNNETGVIQPLDELVPIVQRAGGIAFADCSQSAGKMALPDADLIAVSAHKLGGPPGIGALLVRDLRDIEPDGGQEKGYRGGTENLPAILGFAAALEASNAWVRRAEDLRAHLDGALEASGAIIAARKTPRLATIATYRMPGMASAAQLIQFDMAGIAVSAGSACSSGTLKTSHVLAAMGWDEKEAGEIVRVSFGPDTSRADVYRFVEQWQRLAREAKARAA